MQRCCIRVATVRSGVASCQQVTNARKRTDNTRVRLWLANYKQVKLTFSGVRVDKFCEKVKWVDEWQKRLI